MSRLLHSPGLTAEPRTVGMADPTLDSALRAAVEQASEEAYARGHRDGRAAATDAVEQASRRLVEAVRCAMGDLQALAARADVELALDIVRAVLDAEPSADSALLLDRITEALATLDDEHITVRVNPSDVADIGHGLSAVALDGGGTVEVVADPGIPAGEAQLSGRWARADLTRGGALAAIERLLTETVSTDGEEVEHVA